MRTQEIVGENWRREQGVPGRNYIGMIAKRERMKKRESLPAEDKDTKNEETKGERGEQESRDPKEKEESRESKDVKKEETLQGVIEEAEEGDVGEYLTKEEDGKCSIVLRKKTEEIEDKIETAEFQESGEMKKEGGGLESEDESKKDRNKESQDKKVKI